MIRKILIFLLKITINKDLLRAKPFFFPSTTRTSAGQLTIQNTFKSEVADSNPILANNKFAPVLNILGIDRYGHKTIFTVKQSIRSTLSVVNWSLHSLNFHLKHPARNHITTYNGKKTANENVHAIGYVPYSNIAWE